MKKLFNLILFLLFSGKAFCVIDTIQVKSKITDVTVFFNGAQVSREVEVKASKGKHILFIDKLPMEVNAKSIQLSGTKDCKILSLKQIHGSAKDSKRSADSKNFEELIKVEKQKINEINNKISVYDVEEKLLSDNSRLSNEKEPTSVAKLKEAADFYRLRFNEIRQAKLDLALQRDKINDRISEFNSEWNKKNAVSSITYSQVVVVVECANEVSSDLKLTYYVSSAGWTPLYDFRVDDISKPLSIVYNANVYQSSGEEWSNVNLRLSSNDPSLSGTKPELKDWIIGRADPYSKPIIHKGPAAIKGKVWEKGSDEAIAFATVSVYKGGSIITAVSTDIDGQFSIKPIEAGVYTFKVTSIGFQAAEVQNVVLQSDEVTNYDFVLNKGAELNEVMIMSTNKANAIERDEIRQAPTRDVNSIQSTSGVSDNFQDRVNIRNSRADGVSYYVDGMKVTGGIPATYGDVAGGIISTNYISNTLKMSIANLEYVIDIPYTIPSDGEDYNVKIKEVSVSCNYVYHIVPKLDNDAFLVAAIPDWSQLNLLSGKSSIYYEGTFVGNSFISSDQAEDTLNIPLGRDGNIIVKRERNKEVNDKKVFGNNIKEIVGWTITVRNNKTKKVSVLVEDQFPISEFKSIEVENLEMSNAELDEKSGKLTWKLDIESGQKTELNYKYSVKYPRSASVSTE